LKRKVFSCSFLLVLILISWGCSGSGSTNTIAPPTEGVVKTSDGYSSHHTYGLWQFTADPNAGTLECVQVRNGNLHLNALTFLEPPPLVNLTIENLQFNGNIINVDIGLRHPFLGLKQFTGFDVCGVLISNGSANGFDDSSLLMTGDGDTRLLNPDGYTRWWNPAEFPVNNGTIFSYTDGLLGVPESITDYNCTLNAYKYYSDDLQPDDTLDSLTLDNRGIFSTGQKNVRHYTIEVGTGGLVFNYAVDANWKFPSGTPPYIAPDDFGENANRPEAYRLDVSETSNTLFNDGETSGGGLSLSIDVYDWFNAGINIVKVESPGNFSSVVSLFPVDGGPGYSTYEIDITDATPAPDSIDLLITVECEKMGFGGLLPGITQSAYFKHSVDVSDEPQIVDAWPGFMHDERHTGVADCILDPDTLELKWTFPVSGAFRSSAVISDGTAYIGNDDMSVYAIDIFTGTEEWHTPLDSDVTGTAAVDVDYIYIGTVAGYIYALDRVDGSTEWTYQVLEGSPDDEARMINGTTLVDDTIFFCANNGYVYSLDATDGSQNWVSPTFDYGGNTLHSVTAYYAAANQVIVTTDGFKVMAFDADDGGEAWQYDVGDFASVSPTLENDRIYFSDWGNYTFCFDISGTNPPSLEWSEPFPSPQPFTSHATGPIDANHYYSCEYYYGKIQAHNKNTGDIEWSSPSIDIKGFVSSPAISGDVIYVPSNEGVLYGFDTATGAEVFSYDIPLGTGYSCIAIAEDRLVLGCADKQVYCFGPVF
jgi:outer membrane protein assembly factor BamB